MKQVIDLDSYLNNNLENIRFGLKGVIRDLAKASIQIGKAVNHAGLLDIIGEAGSENIQGEVVQKLDLVANDIIINTLSEGTSCCLVASEENDEVFPTNNLEAEYVVAMDPLDGSSNIDVNVSIGTIFAVYRRESKVGTKANLKDILQTGKKLSAAGYILYGSSTMMVLCIGENVVGFTLDRNKEKFFLSHPSIVIPEQGNTYSVNEAKKGDFVPNLNEYLDIAKTSNNQSKKAYGLRYVGSMVADVHRTLLKGGMFMYPALTSASKGKLRLLYECNPMAFIIEKAGGMASDGKQDILNLEVKELHQRSPIYIGSKNMVKEVLKYTKN